MRLRYLNLDEQYLIAETHEKDGLVVLAVNAWNDEKIVSTELGFEGPETLKEKTARLLARAP